MFVQLIVKKNQGIHGLITKLIKDHKRHIDVIVSADHLVCLTVALGLSPPTPDRTAAGPLIGHTSAVYMSPHHSFHLG